MIVELIALRAYKKWQKKKKRLLDILEDHDKVIHVSRPDNGQKLKTPIRIVDTNGV